MAILGITNRTENWKTAAYFAPLFGRRSVRLARRLGASEGTLEPGDVRLELFWRGMRDHLHQAQETKASRYEAILATYQDRFESLRTHISQFAGFQGLKDHNYRASAATVERLSDNLSNTEIDVVIETPGCLLIGEAKHATGFHANSGLVLTHQLIRQYVMARILLDLSGYGDKAVVPFVVGDNADSLKNSRQVQFMIEHCDWMRPENVLEWSDIEALW